MSKIYILQTFEYRDPNRDRFFSKNDIKFVKIKVTDLKQIYYIFGLGRRDKRIAIKQR